MSTHNNNTISETNLAIIVPTKDRPKPLRRLLTSLVDQNTTCKRIIIVGSGVSVKSVVMTFVDRLPVEYYHCDPPGQIRQRNYAISLLDETTPIVGVFDDDVQLEPDAIETMLQFWASCNEKPGGVACHTINEPPYRPASIFQRLFFISSHHPGQITKAGNNTSFNGTQKNIRTDWLPGGNTFWRLSILKHFLHKEIYARRAYCEDVIFSYPISKKYPLYFCRESCVRHISNPDHNASNLYLYYGQSETLWRMYFVTQNNDLSLFLFFWMCIGLIASDSFRGVIELNPHRIQYALGRIYGVAIGLKVLFLRKDLATLLNEKQ